MTIVYRTDGSPISNAVMDENFEQISNRYEEADIASSIALALTSGYTYFTVTGNTDITSISTVGIGKRITLKFNDAGGAIGDATNLLMPGATTITWRAGDTAVFIQEDASVWRCVSYNRGDISPMGAITQTALDGSTLAASTEYVDAKTANPIWSLHETFIGDDTSSTLGETTTIPSDCKAIRVIGYDIASSSGEATWGVRLRLSDTSTYGSYITGVMAQTNNNGTAIQTGHSFTDDGVGGGSPVDYTVINCEYWNIDGTDKWVGGGMSCELDDAEVFGTTGLFTLLGTLDRLKIDAGANGSNNFRTGSTAEIWILS